MTRVDVWFDPSCPWTWVTTRWLVEGVQPQQELDLQWHLMSLAVLNEGKDLPPEYADKMSSARRTLRVFTAVSDTSGQQALGRLYAALGERLHRQQRTPDEALVNEALAEAGLDTSLVAALDEPQWDEAVRASHDAGQAAVGEPTGSPVLQLEGRAHFGPVLTAVPRGAGALRLFEGLRALASTPEFSELKRPRTAPPDLG